MEQNDSPPPPPLVEGDFYLEGGFMVFTRAYHLKRGFCCKSRCRHCPWDYGKKNGKKNGTKKSKERS